MKLFTKTVCPKCIVVKGSLAENEVEYTQINIDTDSKAKNKLIEKGFMGVPILEHEGKFYSSVGEILELIQELK